MELPRLTGHQKSHLRSLGQRLDPSLSVGKGGVTQALLRELDHLLAGRELVKVRLLAERDDREALMEALAAGTRSAIVGSVGKTVLLYRAAPTSRADRIRLPGAPVS